MRIAHLTLVATVFAGSNAPLLAQGNLDDQLSVCARIEKKDARLECFDSVAKAARDGSVQAAPSSAASTSAPTPAPQTTPAPPAASGFGAEAVRPAPGQPRDDGEPGEMTATVTSARDNGIGMWRFELADGAVWRMTERVANFRPPAPNESVTIRKASLGSYLLQVGSQASVRVTRVR